MSTALAALRNTVSPQPPAPLAAGLTSTLNLPLTKIVRSKMNRNAEVDEEFINSIRQNGVVEHILVRPIQATVEHVTEARPDTPFAVGEQIYEIVFGERRWRGARLAGCTHIGAQVRNLSDVEALELQIIENEQRENLTPLQRCEAYDRLRQEYLKAHAGEADFSETKCVKQVAARVNREARTVYQVLQLKQLVWQAQDALRHGEMEASHAYEICRRSGEEQLKILAWIRAETLRSDGEIPSVRWLKGKIVQIDQTADELREQQARLSQPGAGTTTTAAAFPAASSPPHTTEPDKESWRCGMCTFINSPRNKKKCHRCGAERGYGVDYQSPAKEPGQTEAFKIPAADPHERIEKNYQDLFFAALAGRAQINSRFLTHVIPDLIFQAWQNGQPIESFAQKTLGWPAPRIAGEPPIYSRNEVRRYAKKHTRKFSSGVLVALMAMLYMNPPAAENLARRFKVNPEKLRKQAAAVVSGSKTRERRKGKA